MLWGPKTVVYIYFNDTKAEVILGNIHLFSDYVGVADQVAHFGCQIHMVEYNPCYLCKCAVVAFRFLSDSEVPFLFRFIVQLINDIGVFKASIENWGAFLQIFLQFEITT